MSQYRCLDQRPGCHRSNLLSSSRISASRDQAEHRVDDEDRRTITSVWKNVWARIIR